MINLLLASAIGTMGYWDAVSEEGGDEAADHAIGMKLPAIPSSHLIYLRKSITSVPATTELKV